MKRWAWIWYAAVLSAGAAALGWYLWRDRAAWERIHERAAQFEAERPRGVVPHVPLMGTARSGDSAKHLTRACELLKGVLDAERTDPESFDWYGDWADGALPANAEEALAPYLPVLDEFGAAARSDSRTLPALDAPSPLGQVFPAAKLAVRVALAKRDARLAIDRSMGVLGVADEMMRSQTALDYLLGLSGVGAIVAAWNEESLGRIDATALRELAALLTAFDARFDPRVSALDVKCELLWKLRAPKEEGRLPQRTGLLLAELEFIDELPAIPSLPWSAREPRLAAVLGKFGSFTTSKWLEIERQRRAVLTELRMLRLAALHHAGDPLPALADPLGDGDLEVVRAEGELLLRSQGKQSDGKRIDRRVARR